MGECDLHEELGESDELSRGRCLASTIVEEDREIDFGSAIWTMVDLYTIVVRIVLHDLGGW